MSDTQDERFKNWAAGVQSLVTALAIVVAGLWTIITFWALGTSTRAKAETEALLNANRAKPVLTVIIDVDSLRFDLNGRKVLRVNVTLRNDGDTYILLGLPPKHLAAAQVRAVGEDSVPLVLDRPRTAHVIDVDSTGAYPRLTQEVPPHAERKLHYLIDAPSPGLYLVGFSSLSSPELFDLAENQIKGQRVIGSDVAKQFETFPRRPEWGGAWLGTVK